jgi:hypothetical protein
MPIDPKLAASILKVTGAPASHVEVAQANLGSIVIPRPVRAVVRADDLLSLGIELVNLQIVANASPGQPPRLQKADQGDAFLILHFPPQAIADQTFFQSSPPGITFHDGAADQTQPMTAPGGETPASPPIRARVAGATRLCFVVPDGFACEYTLAGVLTACQSLALSVGPTARTREGGRASARINPNLHLDVSKLSATARADLTSAALRDLRIARTEGAGSPLLRLRAEASPSSAIREAARQAGLAVATTEPGPVVTFRSPPVAPTATQTAIELPLRLILSPHAGGRFVHQVAPAGSPLTGRVELWHTRLGVSDGHGHVTEEPGGDKTLRAVWMRAGEGSQTFNPAWPTPTTKPAPDTAGTHPYRMTLDDNDRFQIVHLSSNYNFSNYVPAPIDCDAMMLSALGGWLDARGAWDPMAGLSVEEWVHRATMARDHYVRVVYKGFLLPFGHRASLIKVSERRFHNDLPGNPAYLRQRMYIVVRERDRSYDRTDLGDAAGTQLYHRMFPFSRVRITTTVTPDLMLPTDPISKIVDPPVVASASQNLFWPCVSGNGPGGGPFGFHLVATDLDGRAIELVLPLIFISNELAAPPKVVSGKIEVDQPAATKYFAAARKAWLTTDPARKGRRVAQLHLQRVALAPSVKPGDTSSELEQLEFGAEVDNLVAYATQTGAPQCVPTMVSAQARIPAVAHLSGSTQPSTLTWNAPYLQHGFNPAKTKNAGQVFVNVGGPGALDFGRQGQRSGGFIQPNLRPSALSRMTGPIAGDVATFAQGDQLDPAKFFHDLSPLLFGCIPLADVILGVTGLAAHPEKLPRFISEATTKVEALFGDLGRLQQLAIGIGGTIDGLINSLIGAALASLDDLASQALVLATAQRTAIRNAVNAIKSALSAARTAFSSWLGQPPPLPSPPSLAAVTAALGQLAAAIAAAPLPAGIRQSAMSQMAQLADFVDDAGRIPPLVNAGIQLAKALDPLVSDPTQIGALLADPDGTLKPLLAALVKPPPGPLGAFRAAATALHLLDGAPLKAALVVIDALAEGLAALDKLIDLLAGEELVVRLDWRPEIGSVPAADPIFRANDRRGLVVAVEARMKRSGAGTPKVQVVCGLNHFDLLLIGQSSAFIELAFEKIEFRIDQSRKMNTDVVLKDIRFVGCLAFVETLRDLIPLDGFSDPPALEVSDQGLDASFSLALPNIAVGMFSLTNVSLGAGFTVPFIGQPMSVRFNFCTREQPFNLTVSMFGGGGFFGITIDPRGVQLLEAAFEFGASISVDFGVASGGVHVMAGVYYRMEQGDASLTGYFRLGGEVDVLGLISASLELYLELRYEFPTGKCVGRASLTIEVDVFLFSFAVTVECERKFAGSNGDPTFAQLMGPSGQGPIDEDTLYPWREYCEAFAA